MKHNLTKRLMSLLLALVLVIGMLPMNVFAAQAAEPEVPDTTQDPQQTDPAPEPDPSQTPAPAAEGTYHVSAVGGSHLSIRFNYTNAGGQQTHTYYTKASYIDQDVKIGAGVSLLFTLDSSSAYTVGSEDVTCTVGGEPVALVYSVTAGYPHFSLPDTLATGGDVVFTINEQLADGWIPVNTDLTNCTLEGSDLVKVGGTYTGKLTPAEGYILPTTITRTYYYGTYTVDVAEDGSFSFTVGSAETQITSTTIKASGVVPAAKIGTTLYRTLEEALADANANGGTIVILKDYVGIDAEEVNITGDVTIDANGFKFYTSSDRFGTMFVKNGAKLTLTGNGSCYGNYYDEAIRVEAGGTLQVDSGITFATDGATNILNYGTTTFSGTGHYVTNEGGVMHVYGTVEKCLLNSGGTMNIYDGALLSRTSQIPLQNRVKGTVNIYGGTIHGGSSSMSSSSGMVNIYGGTFYKAIEVSLDNTNYADDPQIGKYMISGGNFPNGLTVTTYSGIAEKTMVEDIIAEGKGVYADGSYVSDLNVASISGNVTVGEKQTVYVAAVALGTANEQKFETIEEAMDAAVTLKGQTVSLLSDTTFTDGASVTFDVNTFVKIDLCGYTLTLSDADGFVCANTFILDSSSAMSGKLVADEAIWTVCNFTIQSGTVDADIYVTDMSNLHGALYIKGGSYKGTLQRAGADNTISLQGGTFLGGVALAASYDTTDDVELADLIPSGKAYYLSGSPVTLSAGQMSITGGDVTIGEKPADTVMLEIGSTVTKYPTIDAAIAAVNSSTATQAHEITLLANVTAAADLMPNKMLVIDLCGKTLELGTNQIITSNGNSLVLYNTNSAVGTISGSNPDCLIEANSSVSIQTKVTVDNTAYDNAVSVTASGSLTSSGTIDSVLSVKDVTINAGTVRSIVNNGGAVYIRNGSVGAANVQYPIENNLEGTIYVYGGEITGSIGVIASSGKVYISGGTFTGKLISSLDNTNYSPAKTGSFELSGGTYKNGITVEGMYLADILKANHVYFQRSIEITPTATQTAITGSDVTVEKPVVAIVEIDGVSKEFTDIEAAFERAHLNNGAIVTLVHDVKIVESMYLPAVRDAYEMTLDLNGRTMAFYDDAYATYGYLTLCDSFTGGMITRTNSSDEGVKCAISVHEDGHLDMTGGTVQGAYSEDDSSAAFGAYGTILLVEGGSATFEGGSVLGNGGTRAIVGTADVDICGDAVIGDCTLSGATSIYDTATVGDLSANSADSAFTIGGSASVGIVTVAGTADVKESASVEFLDVRGTATLSGSAAVGEIDNSGTLTISGTPTFGSVTNNGALTIEGGTLDTDEEFSLHIGRRTATAELSGGTYKNGLVLTTGSLSDLTLADILADGKAYYCNGTAVTLEEGQMAITGGDVTIGEKPAAPANTAAVTHNEVATEYPTLADALAAANAITEYGTVTVSLLTDLTAASDLTFTGTNMVLDLRDHTLDLGANRIVAAEGASLYLRNSGEQNVTISGANSDYMVEANGTLMVQTRIDLDNTAGDKSITVGKNGSLSIYGTVEHIASEGKVTVENGAVRSIVNNGGKLIVSGGSVGGSDVDFPIMNNFEGTTTLSGGTVTGAQGIKATSGTVTIGSTAIIDAKLIASEDGMNYVPSKHGSFLLCGGTFKNGLTIQGATIADSLDRNYWCYLNGAEVTLADNQTAITGGDVTVKAPYMAAVTYNGTTTNYADLDYALSRLSSSGVKITILHDGVASDTYLAVYSGNEATIDLNGFTLGLDDCYFNISGTLHLTDSGSDGKLVRVDANPTIPYAISLRLTGKLIMDGGTVQGSYCDSASNSYGSVNIGGSGAVEISGGSVLGNGDIYAINGDDTSRVTLSGSAEVGDCVLPGTTVLSGSAKAGTLDCSGSGSITVGGDAAVDSLITPTAFEITDNATVTYLDAIGTGTLKGNAEVGRIRVSGSLTISGTPTFGTINNSGSLTIEGGTLDTEDTFSITMNGRASATISGGTYKNGFTIKDSTANGTSLAALLADGKAYYQNGNPITLTPDQLSITGGDVTIGEKPEDPTAALTIGSETTTYTSLADAIAAASRANTNCTIKLLRDTTEYNTNDALFYTGKNGQLTIDFGAYTLTCDEIVSGTMSSMKLIGTTGGVNGEIVFYGPSRAMGDTISNTLPSCSIESGVYHGTVKTWLAADLTINGGTFTSDGLMIYADDAPIDIYGGSFTAPAGILADGYDANVDIHGGTFTLTDDSAILLRANNSADIWVYDGTFTAAYDVSGDVTLHGGTFKDGIYARSTTLAEILGVNKAYYQNGSYIALSSNQQSIAGGDVTVDYAPYAASLTANGSTTNYYSFKAALDAAKGYNDPKITLLRDTTESELTYSGTEGTLTVDFGANRLTCTKLICGGYSTMKLTGTTGGITATDCIQTNNLLTIDSGVYNGKFYLWMLDSTLEINGGTFTSDGRILEMSQGSTVIHGGTFTSADGFALTSGGFTFGTLDIYGGTFELTDPSAPMFTEENGVIRLSGGTFKNGLRVSGNDLGGILWVTKQYWQGDTPLFPTDGQREFTGGDITVEEKAVASVTSGGTTSYYKTLESAVAAFNESSGTMTLLADITASGNATGDLISLNLPSTGILDLNGHSIKANTNTTAIYIQPESRDLRIKDSSAAQTGKVTGGSYSVLNYSGGSVTITSGSYEAIGNAGLGKLTIDGGTFDNSYLYSYTNYGGSLTINGGTFNRGIQVSGGPTAGDLLGSGKAFCYNGMIFPAAAAELSGTTFMVNTGSPVTVVNASDAVASFTNGTDTYYYTTLAAAIAKEGEEYNPDNLVTLLRDTDEDITITDGVTAIFKAKATGVFTIEFSSIYLAESLPEGVSLRIRLDEYPAYAKPVLVPKMEVYDQVNLTVDDVIAVDDGAVVSTNGRSILLGHEHEWVYTLEDTANGEKISVTCTHPDSCSKAENTVFAYVELEDTEWTYNGEGCTAVLNTMETIQHPVLPESDDIKYFDANANPLPGAPVDVGSYIARITYGDKTAEATLVIEKASVTAEDFRFTAPNDPVYNGQSKEAILESTVSGIGEITVKYYDSEGNELAEAPVDAGTYTVKVSVAENKNCEGADLENDDWTFTIERSPVTITATDISKVYGEDDPALTFEREGPEDAYSFLVPLQREEGSDVGTYAITLAVPADELDPNHDVTFIPGVFTIEPKELTAAVILSETELVWNGSAHEPAVTVMDGETEIPADEYTVTYSNNVLPGTATVTIEDVQGGNYTVTGVATFTIAAPAAPDTVTPDDREDLETVKDALEDMIEQLPEGEDKDERQEILDEIEDMLDSIDRIEAAEDLLENLPETADPDDEDALNSYFEAKDAYDSLSDYEKTLIDEELAERLENLAAALVAYLIIEGDDQTWTKGSGKDLAITANGLYSKFESLEIDGETVDPEHYSAESGSTVVTLKASFLETLKVGKHTVTFVYPDGKAEGTLTIEAAPVTDNGSEKPDTGDHSALLVWFAVMAAAACGAVLTLRKKREQ